MECAQLSLISLNLLWGSLEQVTTLNEGVLPYCTVLQDSGTLSMMSILWGLLVFLSLVKEVSQMRWVSLGSAEISGSVNVIIPMDNKSLIVDLKCSSLQGLPSHALQASHSLHLHKCFSLLGGPNLLFGRLQHLGSSAFLYWFMDKTCIHFNQDLPDKIKLFFENYQHMLWTHTF